MAHTKRITIQKQILKNFHEMHLSRKSPLNILSL